jgi:hypothetical protein
MPKSKNSQTGKNTFKKTKVERRRAEQASMARATERLMQARKRSSEQSRHRSWY